jgi:hypothetical protein
MDPGIDHGGVQFLVAEELLNGGDPAACVQELGGGGVAQAVRVDLHNHPIPGRFEASTDQILADRLIAVQENMVSGSRSTDGQVFLDGLDGGIGHEDGPVFHVLGLAHGQATGREVQVLPPQLFDLADAQSALPERQEGGPVEQGIPPTAEVLRQKHPLFEIIPELLHLLIGEELGQWLGLFQAGNAQERLRHGIALFLKEAQEAMQIAYVGVDGGGGIALFQEMVDEIEQEPALDVFQFLYLAFLTQEVPDPQVLDPEVVDSFLQAGLPPVALLDVLEAGHFLDEPGGQSFGMQCGFKGPHLDLQDATLVAEKAAELEHGTAADVGRLGAHLLGMQEVQAPLEIGLQIQL